ncbi:hypothetical protein P170DRAFT_372530 [Aspergillus steynii IBT 23096]|uniref:Tachykinin family protein n=1 Tax=Aspergillus steynii IBT 23096 TaxID=1392250 RepID=A0A2I2GM29_9EURO|nr:uncharacterized protein P170DRAFT_372530 [Aspergillus steynii IBT 23096]PLB53933.1 hypothetical protein P170DRAFT_372530 [Aspergillus steynii IBT 23096]
MFIPYTGPSSNKDASTRRAVNAFIAADAGAKRRLRKGESTVKKATGTLQWVQVPGSRDPLESSDETRKDRRRSRTDSSRRPLSVRKPLGGGRFYPIEGIGSKGPLTLHALSHYFDILLPHDANALGLGEAARGSYTSGLLSWASQHDVILHGLSAFTLCSVESQDSTGATSRAILYHRNRLLGDLHERLSRRQVDDVLIQAICLLIPVDDYLGYVEYGPVHLKGLRDVVQIRGGFDEVGSSDANAFGKNLRMSMLVVTSMVEFHLQTNISDESLETLMQSEITLQHPREMLARISNLPSGFRKLFLSGYVSDEIFGIVESYALWRSKVQDMDTTSRETWRYSSSCSLNNLEKCIVVALACLADDISAMGTHPAALIFRKPKQRAQVLATVSELWKQPALIDCMIWMCTVISTPRNKLLFCQDAQRQLLKKSIQYRSPSHNWGQVQAVLELFMYDSARESNWKEAWSWALNDLGSVGKETLVCIPRLAKQPSNRFEACPASA